MAAAGGVLCKILEQFAGPGAQRPWSGGGSATTQSCSARWMRWIFPATALCITEKGASNPLALKQAR